MPLLDRWMLQRTAEVVDEITPELFELAKKNVQKKKDDEFKKQMDRSMIQEPQLIYGIDQTPIRYGTKLNAKGLQQQHDNYHRRLNRRWEYSSRIKFLNGPFSNLIFQVLERTAGKLEISLGKLKLSVGKKSNYIYSPIY